VTVGFYAPLPPARTGVADYAAALLAALRRHGRVEVAPQRCDVALYHLGNNQMHAAIYRRALEQPGVVVLHDAVLHHFLLGLLGRPAYMDEFAYNYGEWNRGLATELWQARAGSGADIRYFQFPMLKRAAERARAVMVHNPAAGRVVREHAAQTPVIEIPFPFQQPDLPTDGEAARYRQRLGLPWDAFVFGVFGFLRESKRLLTVLETFARLHAEQPRTALLVAGSFVSTDLERAVEPLLREPGIVRVPYLSEREFWLAASAVDACINLRYPAAGETSAIAIQLMGLSKPVLLTDAEECARFPEDACVRIAAGLGERESLWRHMVLITSLPGVARAIGHKGALYIGEHHPLEQVAQQYWETLCAYSS
jgi:glycosyltransferase involved in cell wall biosynthesis